MFVFAGFLFGPTIIKASTPTEPQIGAAWETMTPLPDERDGLAVVADCKGHIFALGGYTDLHNTPTDTNYRYNIATDTWDTMAPIPDPLAAIDAALINGKIYIPGDVNYTNTYIYNIAANTWTERPSTHTALDDYEVVVIGTDLYMLGGNDTSGESVSEVWILDTTTDIWSPGVPLQVRRSAFAAGVIDGEIYAAGGYKWYDDNLTSVEKFDGATWSYAVSIPQNCPIPSDCSGWSYTSDAVGPQGLWLAGGDYGVWGYYRDYAAYYDPASGVWTTSLSIPTLNHSRIHAGGDLADDGYFYVIGGYEDGDASTANERLLIKEPPFQTPGYLIFLPITLH